MNKFLIAVFAAVFSLGLVVADAEAARVGGGRSSGMQRSVTPKSPAAPAQNAVPAKPAQAQPAAAPQPSGMSRWLGPLAGLAAGIGLAALFSHLGMGEGFASIVMMLLIGLAVFFVVRLLFRRKAPESQSLQYAGNAPAPMQFEAQPATGSAAAPAVAASIPAGFDVDGFLRQAKLNFVRLQAANDSKNIEDIRNFTTPEMFAEIKMEIDERGGGTQQTDVVTLNAELLDVAEENRQYVASVRFHGAIRETEGAAPAAFDEVWHLTKPVDGSRGWAVAGIQQVS
ncbi:MAG: Tim44 domain-containing protein [Rhodocyclales bacterium]|nr:Tim44 domain-containing protein [Rhodocyclales bacterium]